MNGAVRARIVNVGNSKGIRIPKAILEQLGLSEEVELSVCENQLVIRPGKRPRADWEDQFRLMAARGDDRLLDDQTVSTTDWDTDEWQWT
jgi:antitoxin MazE